MIKSEHLTKRGTPKAKAPFPLRIKYSGIELIECNLAGTPKNRCYCFVDGNLIEAMSFKTLINKVDKMMSIQKTFTDILIESRKEQ